MEPLVPTRLLSVDLSTQSVTDEEVPTGWLQSYLGGKGLGARYLYEHVGPHVEPLGTQNVLLFMVGPLTGLLPGDDRFAVVTKSPLTGLFLDSYAGGSFATSFRAAMPAYVGIRVTGHSETSYVLDLRGETPSLERSPELARTPTAAVDDHFPDSAVVTAGPAGERGVAYATIAVDGGDHHAGRGGAGAVMGTKGLKAVVVPTADKVPPPNARIRELQEKVQHQTGESAFGRALGASGTLESVELANALGMLPTRGWQGRRFDGAGGLGLETVRDAAIGRERSDDAVQGDFRIAVSGQDSVIRGGTPIALGANLGIAEFDAVAELGLTCDRLGLDVISAGHAIALAAHASAAGRLNRTVSFGDPESARELLEEIATRSTSLGETLAAGVARAAEAFGLSDAVPTVKSMAVPTFDPRDSPPLALAYATSDRGACHRRAIPAFEQSRTAHWTETQIAHAVAADQDRRALLWCLIVDDVTTPLFPGSGQQWLSALGVSLSASDLARIGRRTWTLTRLFNVREGVDRQADSLPALFRDEGSAMGDPRVFDRLLDRYYEYREWDRRGRPSRRLLERLDLDAVVDEYTPVGDPPLHSTRRSGLTRMDDVE